MIPEFNTSNGFYAIFIAFANKIRYSHGGVDVGQRKRRNIEFFRCSYQ